MVKRRAETQLTKDDVEGDEQDSEEVETFTVPQNAARDREDGGLAAASSDAGNAAGAKDYPVFNFAGGMEEPEDKKASSATTKKRKVESSADQTSHTDPPMDASNPLSKFLLQSSDVECPACSVPNPKGTKKCRACETDMDSDASAFAASSASSASSSSSSSSSADFGSGFSFSGNDGGFSFGATAATSEWDATDWGFSNSSAAPSTSSSFAADTFSFTFGNGQQGDAAAAAADSADSSQAENLEEENAMDKPSGGIAEEFQGKSAEPTGDDKDTVQFKSVCKLYVMTKLATDDKEKETDKWQECGKGELRINTVEQDGKTFGRLLIRMERTHKLLLNAPIFRDMKYNIESDKFVRVVSLDLDKKVAAFLLKFANKAAATEVVQHIDKVIAMLSAP